tara:strand:+ start:142 stop:411 length:270 start_codon:yes stop_codon:yes gene_type:complete
MERTTQKQLEFMCARINSAKKTPLAPYERIDGSLVGQIGNFHLSGAYGGVCLHQTMNEGGGVRDVFSCGHVTKRDLYNRMSAYLVACEA